MTTTLTPPRIPANEILLDRSIRHAVMLERFKLSEIGRIQRFLNRKLLPAIEQKVASGLLRLRTKGRDLDDVTKIRRTRAYRRMLAGVHEASRAAAAALTDDMAGSLRAFAKSEAAFATASVKAAVPIELAFAETSPTLLRSIVTSRPFRGKLLAEHAAQWGAATTRRVADAINVGIGAGEGVDDIVRRVAGTRSNAFTDGVLQISRHHARTIVRTAVNHVSTHAREAAYQEMEVVKAVMWVSTLDGKTTDICASLDGREFKVGQGHRPPAHMNCRSTTVPVLKSWRELGIDLKQAPAGTRESMNGLVPAKQTYATWLRKQPADFQNSVLGVERGKLFRRGKVPLRRFVDHRLRPLKLSELEALEREALAAA